MVSFISLPTGTWQLHLLADGNRRRRLRRSYAYPQLVARLAARSEVLQAIVRPADTDRRALRVEAILRVEASDLDLFFNSASGYRAQYYQAEDLGNAANRLAMDALIPNIVAQAIHVRSKQSARDLARSSLEAVSAKVWVYQGAWLRLCRKEERVLTVPRWQLNLSSEDRRARKLVRWGALAPATETRIVVKGAFIADGRAISLGKAPRDRTSELHNFGFT